MDQHVGHKPDPLVRLVAAHPTEQLLVAIVGPDIRIVDCRYLRLRAEAVASAQGTQQAARHQQHALSRQPPRPRALYDGTLLPCYAAPGLSAT